MSYSSAVDVKRVDMVTLYALLSQVKSVRLNIGLQAVGLMKARRVAIEHEISRRVRTNQASVVTRSDVDKRIIEIQAIESQESSDRRTAQAEHVAKHKPYAELDMSRSISQMKPDKPNSFGFRALLRDVMAIR
jgi:hypothetical protein